VAQHFSDERQVVNAAKLPPANSAERPDPANPAPIIRKGLSRVPKAAKAVKVPPDPLGAPADNIRLAVHEQRYVFSLHANHRLRARRIMAWQVVAGLDAAKLMLERPNAAPNPVAEFDQILSDGTAVKTVWAWISRHRTAKLVTVYFL
jgi:hypothetical protein